MNPASQATLATVLPRFRRQPRALFPRTRCSPAPMSRPSARAAALLPRHLRPLRVAVRGARLRRGLLPETDQPAPPADLLLPATPPPSSSKVHARRPDRAAHRPAPGIHVRGRRGRDELGRPRRRALRLAHRGRSRRLPGQGARVVDERVHPRHAFTAGRLEGPVLGGGDGHRARAHPPRDLLGADAPARAAVRQAASRLAALRRARRAAGQHAGRHPRRRRSRSVAAFDDRSTAGTTNTAPTVPRCRPSRPRATWSPTANTSASSRLAATPTMPCGTRGRAWLAQVRPRRAPDLLGPRRRGLEAAPDDRGSADALGLAGGGQLSGGARLLPLEGARDRPAGAPAHRGRVEPASTTTRASPMCRTTPPPTPTCI